MIIDTPGETMLTVEEVAEKLNVSIMTVRRMIQRGEIEAFKVGSQLRIDEGEYAAYLERQRHHPRPKNATRPARLSESEMSKVGVDFTQQNNGSIFLRCQICGSLWSPNMLPGGRLPKNYWRCPNGCNSDERLKKD